MGLGVFRGVRGRFFGRRDDLVGSGKVSGVCRDWGGGRECVLDRGDSWVKEGGVDTWFTGR